MDQKSESISHLTDQFLKFEKELERSAVPGLLEKRGEAARSFQSLGFPTTADEEWRFTNLSKLSKIRFDLPNAPKALGMEESGMPALGLPRFDSHLIVFLNGTYSPGLSVFRPQPGVKISALPGEIGQNRQQIADIVAGSTFNGDNFFESLSRAFFGNGIYISIEPGVDSAFPFQIIFINGPYPTAFITHPRILISLGQDSRASVVEHYINRTESIYLTNATTNVILGRGSKLEHVKIQQESGRSFHVGNIFFRQEESSHLSQSTLMVGSAIARNNLYSTLAGENISCTFNGLSLADKDQLIDNHTTIDHAKPSCESHELYKSILKDNSRGVFNGKIYVRKDAQKTDAKQTNRTLLLSDGATMDTKPQLEIFADDVKCTHGAAVGYLDSEAIFYLRSRGIDEPSARDILTHAFANEIIEKIGIEQVRHYLGKVVHEKLIGH